jgi:hypothetical protein
MVLEAGKFKTEGPHVAVLSPGRGVEGQALLAGLQSPKSQTRVVSPCSQNNSINAFMRVGPP